MADIVSVAQEMEMVRNRRKIDQPHHFDVLRIDADTSEKKMKTWIAGCHQLRGVNKVGVIFHRIEASDQPDQTCILRYPKFTPDLGPGAWVRLEFLEI